MRTLVRINVELSPLSNLSQKSTDEYPTDYGAAFG